jgi:hypothetical protein
MGRALYLAALTLALTVPACTKGRDRSDLSVPLVLEVSPFPEAQEQRDAPGSSGADVGLALNAMSDGRRKELAGALSTLADQVERKHNPLVEDLDDDARPPVERMLRDELPSLTAAAALAPGRWVSADQKTMVRATTACASGARCIALQGPGKRAADAGEAEARFLAWPIDYSVIVRVAPGAASEVLDALRTQPAGSRIALALGDEDRRGVRYSDALPELSASAMRIARGASDSPMVSLFRRLSASAPADGALDWLTLPTGSILVVPRLSALASVGDFVEEVRTRLASQRVPVEWLYDPTD